MPPCHNKVAVHKNVNCPFLGKPFSKNSSPRARVRNTYEPFHNYRHNKSPLEFLSTRINSPEDKKRCFTNLSVAFRLSYRSVASFVVSKITIGIYLANLSQPRKCTVFFPIPSYGFGCFLMRKRTWTRKNERSTVWPPEYVVVREKRFVRLLTTIPATN